MAAFAMRHVEHNPTKVFLRVSWSAEPLLRDIITKTEPEMITAK
jgi:hypothetical protein